jgi:hypothetical protein
MSTTIDGSASVTINSGAVLGITSGTVATPTSGTAVTFTGIPSWAKRITISLVNLTYSAAVQVNMQIGSGSVATTGYTSTGSVVFTANVTGVTNGSGTGVQSHGAYTSPISGQFVWILVNPATNLWLGSGTLAYTGNTGVATATGYITLAGAPDRVQINTVAGTATFTAGSINIMYEG